MGEKYDPLPDLAKLVVSALGYNTVDPAHYAGRIAVRLGIGEDWCAGCAEQVLRKALGPEVTREQLAAALRRVPVETMPDLVGPRDHGSTEVLIAVPHDPDMFAAVLLDDIAAHSER